MFGPRPCGQWVARLGSDPRALPPWPGRTSAKLAALKLAVTVAELLTSPNFS